MVNEVFFLGAGFSIALANSCVTNGKTYPTLKNLTNEILGDFSKTSLGTHLHEISQKYTENIELLLTYLSTDLPWQNQQMIHLDKALYFELTSKISKYFNDLDKVCEYNFEPFKNLSTYITGNKIPIITLNYDTLLERMLLFTMPKDSQNANSYNEFYKQPIMSLSDRKLKHALGYSDWNKDDYGENLPIIHKLHGSINWLWSGINPTEPIYYTSGKEHESLRKDLSEYIVPPVLDKSRFYNHNIIKSIWSDAYSVLKNAKNVYIVGFSFPETDLSVKFLFNSAFSNRDSKPNIYVINTAEAINKGSNSYLKNRYDDIFKDLYVDYTYCCDNSLEKFMKERIVPKSEEGNATK